MVHLDWLDLGLFGEQIGFWSIVTTIFGGLLTEQVGFLFGFVFCWSRWPTEQRARRGLLSSTKKSTRRFRFLGNRLLGLVLFAEEIAAAKWLSLNFGRGFSRFDWRLREQITTWRSRWLIRLLLSTE